MEPSTIVCGDGNVETTVGFVLLLYPWLRKVVEEPGSYCGRNPFSILVIPNTKVETMINLTNLVTKGNLKVTKSWKKSILCPYYPSYMPVILISKLRRLQWIMYVLCVNKSSKTKKVF